MQTRLAAGLVLATVAVPAIAILALMAAPDARSRAPVEGARIRTPDGELVPAERLGNSEYCGHCHTQIFHEWKASAHHFSSLSNPIYRSVVRSTADRRGTDVLRLCAGCHDPLPLAAGEPITGEVQTWSSTAGITCLACHRITEVHGDNGAYTLSPPTLHPFAFSDHPWLQSLHKWLLGAFPSLHRSVLSKPLYETAEYCAACHTVAAEHETNGASRLVLQNEHSSWQASRFATPAHADGDPKTCLECHMPEVSSNDPAARDGKIRSHRFVGGHTLLPALNRDHEQLAATHAFLESGVVSLGCARIRGGQSSSAACEQAPGSTNGRLEITFVLENLGVGHDFPAGTNESNQVWLEVTATDATGRTLYQSGALGADGDPEPSAYFLRKQYADAAGNPLDRRTASTDAAVLVGSTVLGPGASVEVPYSLKLDSTARFPITIGARLNWRKYSAAFLRSVFDAHDRIEIPLTVMAETTVTVEGR